MASTAKPGLPTWPVAAGALILGGGSLLLFGFFLWNGALNLFDLKLSSTLAHCANLGLSMLFFTQHSLMVRRWIRRRLPTPPTFHAAFYSIISGMFLLGATIFWQPIGPLLVSVQGLPRLALRLVFISAIVLFWWAIRSIRGFDGFGTRELSSVGSGRTPENRPLTIRGAYRWIRHPLYTGVILMIWSCPDVTADRMLFNLVWTAWIVVATRWEERDLVADFGADYLTYQKTVPMLVPWRPPANL